MRFERFSSNESLKIVSIIKKSILFRDMSREDIERVLICSKSKITTFSKNSMIFNELDIPSKLYILLDGNIAICKDTSSGKRLIVNIIESKGDVFGEIFLFMKDKHYDFYTLATKNSRLVEIPKEFFLGYCENRCDFHAKLLSNMMEILANKAYYLNQKIQVLSSGTLRQKIIKYLLDNCDNQGLVNMSMNREVFADYLTAARPSLSRELLKMQDEKLIFCEGKDIKICDIEALETQL